MCDIKRCFNQSKCSLTCKHEKGLSKHEKGLSKHEKGLSEHEKGLSDLNQSKMYRQFVTKGSNYGLNSKSCYKLLHSGKFSKRLIFEKNLHEF